MCHHVCVCSSASLSSFVLRISVRVLLLLPVIVLANMFACLLFSSLLNGLMLNSFLCGFFGVVVAYECAYDRFVCLFLLWGGRVRWVGARRGGLGRDA